MDFPPRLLSTVVQFETPNWQPLIDLLEEDLVGWFMWMEEAELEDGTRVHGYKHQATRRYSHLGEDGRAFVYLGWVDGPSGYHETTRVNAIMAALGEWESLLPWPDDMPTMRTSVLTSMWRAVLADTAAARAGDLAR